MIGQLQRLAPTRLLSTAEALAVAELQAQRLRQLLGVTEGAVSEQQLRALGGIIIERVPDLGVSGATRLIDRRWVILLNRDDPPVRQRFTIAHELKHILDHPAALALQISGAQLHRQTWLTERICDYFAACLLMPRPLVKRAWTTGSQDLRSLADRFQVSIDAMRIRLEQIGLVEPAGRCAPESPDVVPLVARSAA
jgi:predicted transcriptional regulator